MNIIAEGTAVADGVIVGLSLTATVGVMVGITNAVGVLVNVSDVRDEGCKLPTMVAVGDVEVGTTVETITTLVGTELIFGALDEEATVGLGVGL